MYDPSYGSVDQERERANTALIVFKLLSTNRILFIRVLRHQHARKSNFRGSLLNNPSEKKHDMEMNIFDTVLSSSSDGTATHE